MYRLKHSIRKHAVGCAGLVCLILVVASASRCTSDSITGAENPRPEIPGPGNPGPPNPDPVDTPLGVGSVTLSPDSLTVGVDESAQLSVIVRDTDGAVIANPKVVFRVGGLMDGTVDRNGLVTGLDGGCGRGTVVAWSGRVSSNAAVITVGSPSAPGCWDFLSEVGSVTLSPDSITATFGDTVHTTVIVYDKTGTVIPNPQPVVYSCRAAASPLHGARGACGSLITLDSTGFVFGGGRYREGIVEVVAQSGGVSSNPMYLFFAIGDPNNPWDY